VDGAVITSEATWSRADIPCREDHLQMAVSTVLRRRGIVFAADQNEGRRSPRDGARRKAMGMTAGEPDLRIYLPGGRVLFVELKAKRGHLSPAQEWRQEQLRALGHRVETVYAKTPADAVDQVLGLLG
jgi:hypothetical protein